MLYNLHATLPIVLSVLYLTVEFVGASDHTYDFAQKGEFRLKKYNEIWHEVQHKLNANDQRELYISMVELDGLALISKHEAENGKKCKLSGKELDQKLTDLLRKYNLNEEAQTFKENERNLWKEDDKKVDTASEKLIDKHPNLLKLWQEAEKSGFDDQELLKLKQEFVHYAEKQEMHQQRLKDHNGGAENSVSISLDDTGTLEKDERHAAEPDDTSNLKEENKILNVEWRGLAEKIASKKAKSADGSFTNAKTKYLWESASKSGHFNDQQLEDLRNELSHFDNKLNKLNFAQNDLTDAKLRLKKKGKFEHSNMDEYRFMEQKLKDYERKADKLEQYLRQKVEL